MPNDTQLVANPRKILELAQNLLKDMSDLKECSDQFRADFKKLGETYLEDGYAELGSCVLNITNEIDGKEVEIKEIVSKLCGYAEELIKNR